MIAACLATVVLIAAGCHQEPREPWIARVNDQEIALSRFRGEVERALARHERNRSEVPAVVERALRDHVLARMIDDELLAQKAESLAVEVADREVEAALGRLRAGVRGSRADDTLGELFGSEPEILAALRRRLAVERALATLEPTLSAAERAACERAAGPRRGKGEGGGGEGGGGDIDADEAVTAMATSHRSACLRRAVASALRPAARIETQVPATAP